MEVLSANTLADALVRCRDYPGYQVVIIMSDHSRLREFMSSIREYLRNDESEDVLSVTRAGIIKFKNGSYIRPIMADSKVRGVYAHEVIHDGDIGDEMSIATRVRKIIYHCQEEEAVTLDDFLSKFKIVNHTV